MSYKRKESASLKRRIAFRVDGNQRIGLGHLVRCRNLADYLFASEAVDVCIFTKDYQEASALFAKRYPIKVIPSGLEEEAETRLLFDFLTDYQPHLIITDCQDTTATYVERISGTRAKTVNFDDLGSGREHCDLLIDANLGCDNVPTGPVVLSGPAYMVLHPLFAELRVGDKLAPMEVNQVLISLGGSDSENLTRKVVEALRDLPFNFTVVVGKAYPHYQELYEFVQQNMENITLLRGVETLAPLIAKADLVVIAAGITLYETLCLGVPAIVLAQEKHQELIAQRYAGEKVIRYLGVGEVVGEEKIRTAFAELAANQALRQAMTEKGSKLVDGQGIERISQHIVAMLP